MSPFSEFPFYLTHGLVYDYSLWISYVSFIFPKLKFLETTKNKTKTGEGLSRHEAAQLGRHTLTEHPQQPQSTSLD